MSDGLDVDSDFKKARAFLVTYSTLALLLWYFSADLSSISILGNTVKLKENTNHAWLVASFINVYFLLRFIQKVPAGSFAPDDAMRLSTDTALIWLSRKWYDSTIVEYVDKKFSAICDERPDRKLSDILSIRAQGAMPYWRQLEENRKKLIVGNSLVYTPVYDRRSILFSVSFTFGTETDKGHSNGGSVEVSACSGLVFLSRVYGFAKAGLLTPWFTDYIVPVLYALASIAISLVAWWKVNHVYLVC